MALTAGTRLGVYEVVSQIGQGGMGQVYQARDTTLNRDPAPQQRDSQVSQTDKRRDS